MPPPKIAPSRLGLLKNVADHKPQSLTPFDRAPVVSVALHRWKFSESTTTYAEPCVWRPELGLGFAGDAFGGPRVEGAALSGLALAEKMTAGVVK